MSNIQFNISQEALDASASSDYTPIPEGSYNATIYDIKQEFVKSGPNEGKPRFNIQFRLSDAPYANRRVFGYVALYAAGDFWKTKAFFSALGIDMAAGTFTVPDAQDLLGKPIGVRVKVGKDQNGADRNEVAGFDKATSGSAADAVMASVGATPVASSGNVW